jgi:hypothetical protein
VSIAGARSAPFMRWQTALGKGSAIPVQYPGEKNVCLRPFHHFVKAGDILNRDNAKT